MLGFRVPDANQAMLISGKKGTPSGQPFAVVLGDRKWVPRFLYRVAFLSLEQYRDSFTEGCFTAEKIPVKIVATIAFKIPAEPDAILNAGQRFLSSQGTISEAVGQITTGAVRGIVGEMKLEQIISDRATLQEKVFKHVKDDLEPQGLQVDTLNIADIQDLSDGGSAIAALAAPHLAQIRRDAAIAASNADAEAAQAQQAAAVKQADYERQTQVTKAGYAAEVARASAESQSTAEVAQAEANQRAQVAQADAQAKVGAANAERDRAVRVAQATADAESGKAQAKAAQAGPLEEATARHDVAVAQTALAKQQAEEQREVQRRDVVIPAEAAAEARVASATAEAEATRRAAEAAASSDRVSLDQKIIEQLPLVAGALADGLKGSRLTILNGSDGLTEMTTGLLSQAMAILDAARAMRTVSTNGAGEEAQPVSLGVGASENAEAEQ